MDHGFGDAIGHFFTGEEERCLRISLEFRCNGEVGRILSLIQVRISVRGVFHLGLVGTGPHLKCLHIAKVERKIIIKAGLRTDADGPQIQPLVHLG